MNPLISFFLAIACSSLLAWLALRNIRKDASSNPTRKARGVTVVMSVGCWALLSFFAFSSAISTTQYGRTTDIILNMEGNSPFQAIAQHDPQERDRLRGAVARGIEKANGRDIEKIVTQEVAEELQPYLNRRLSMAPDSVYMALAPVVVAAYRRADAIGGCHIPGDADGDRIRSSMDGHKIMEWADLLVSTAPSSSSSNPISTQEQQARRRAIAEQAVSHGISRATAIAAITPDARAPGRCGAAADMLSRVASNRDVRAAARDVRILLHGFTLPG